MAEKDVGGGGLTRDICWYVNGKETREILCGMFVREHNSSLMFFIRMN